MHLCLYFQVHQPYRLKPTSALCGSHAYFDDATNKSIFLKVAQKCYIPANALIYDLLQRYPTFKCAFSLSGTFLEQCQRYFPEIINSFKRLVQTGRVELLAETYYHSLASVSSKKEFVRQINQHKTAIEEIFAYRPTILRNTELIYNNEIGEIARLLGYEGVIIEGADKILLNRPSTEIYAAAQSGIKLLLKHYRLSDDIAFRFSDKNWQAYPLDANTYASWIADLSPATTVNLFMDYETFGEHQQESAGIFNFLKSLPDALLHYPELQWSLPTQILREQTPIDELNIPDHISWADTERDLSAWLGNSMQIRAFKELYALEDTIIQKGDEHLLQDWCKLQTSDHLYYMCTKWFNDGDVHAYFNPYGSPYEAFIRFMHVVQHLEKRANDT